MVTYAACPHSGLLQRRAKPIEKAWVRVAREAVGADGQVVPQQWLVNTTAVPNVTDRRHLDLVVYGASPLGHVWCAGATMVCPLRRDGQPREEHEETCLARAVNKKTRRYPELTQSGRARLVVLAGENGWKVSQGSRHLRGEAGPGTSASLACSPAQGCRTRLEQALVHTAECRLPRRTCCNPGGRRCEGSWGSCWF